jgi:hypothetical protein
MPRATEETHRVLVRGPGLDAPEEGAGAWCDGEGAGSRGVEKRAKGPTVGPGEHLSCIWLGDHEVEDAVEPTRTVFPVVEVPIQEDLGGWSRAGAGRARIQLAEEGRADDVPRAGSLPGRGRGGKARQMWRAPRHGRRRGRSAVGRDHEPDSPLRARARARPLQRRAPRPRSRCPACAPLAPSLCASAVAWEPKVVGRRSRRRRSRGWYAWAPSLSTTRAPVMYV